MKKEKIMHILFIFWLILISLYFVAFPFCACIFYTLCGWDFLPLWLYGFLVVLWLGDCLWFAIQLKKCF